MLVHEYLKEVETKEYRVFKEGLYPILLVIGILSVSFSLLMYGFSLLSIIVGFFVLLGFSTVMVTYLIFFEGYKLRLIKNKSFSYSFEVCRKVLNRDGRYLVETEDDNLYEVNSDVCKGDKLLVVKYKGIEKKVAYSGRVRGISVF